MASSTAAVPVDGGTSPVDEAVGQAAAKAEAAVQTVEDLRAQLHQHLRDLLPLYEEYEQSVQRKKLAVREYLILTGDELPFGGYFDYRENLLSHQDLKADPCLAKMIKALQFCRACKLS